jgi:excisionase family DNA binding protein
MATVTPPADLSITDVAKILQIHRETVRVLARKGELPGAFRVGGLWRFNSEIFNRFRNGGST